MKSFFGNKNIMLGGMVCGAIVLAAVPSHAFSGFVKPKMLDFAEIKATENADREANQSRKTLVVEIGSKKQLFDGDYLCALADQKPEFSPLSRSIRRD